MSNITINGTGTGTALQELLMSDDIVPGADPSYQTCKTIYTYHPLGAKMAESPIRMAQFKPRMITVPGSPEEKVIGAFMGEWEAINAEKLILQVGALARVYGISSVACLVAGQKPDQPLDFKKLYKANISFNIFDPLNTSGSLVLNQLPTDMDFLKVTGISVQGQNYHRSRAISLLNEQPIYLAYTSSSFGYVGRSVYQRVLLPLKSYVQSMMTDDMVSLKAGLLIEKQKQAGSVVDNVMSWAAGVKRNLLKSARIGNVMSISIEEEIESLNLQNIDGAMITARKNILENIATGADMPAKLLNAETFVEGFGEGTEDAKNVARYVDRIRAELQPLYVFFDKIVQYRAWNEDFYRTLQAQFPELAGKDYNTAFVEWQNAFHAEWPSLLTEPESEKIKVDDTKLKAVIALLEVLLPECPPEAKADLIKWACDNFNDLKRLFTTPLELDYQAIADYEPPAQQALTEPKPEAPFSSKDSAAIRGMIEQAIRQNRHRLTVAS